MKLHRCNKPLCWPFMPPPPGYFTPSVLLGVLQSQREMRVSRRMVTIAERVTGRTELKHARRYFTFMEKTLGAQYRRLLERNNQ